MSESRIAKHWRLPHVTVGTVHRGKDLGFNGRTIRRAKCEPTSVPSGRPGSQARTVVFKFPLYQSENGEARKLIIFVFMMMDVKPIECPPPSIMTSCEPGMAFAS